MSEPEPSHGICTSLLHFSPPRSDQLTASQFPAKQYPGWKTVRMPVARMIMGPSSAKNAGSLFAIGPPKPWLSSTTRKTDLMNMHIAAAQSASHQNQIRHC